MHVSPAQQCVVDQHFSPAPEQLQPLIELHALEQHTPPMPAQSVPFGKHVHFLLVPVPSQRPEQHSASDVQLVDGAPQHSCSMQPPPQQFSGAKQVAPLGTHGWHMPPVQRPVQH